MYSTKKWRINNSARSNYVYVPLGLHRTQSAARLSLRITRVGTHSGPSRFQTYLQMGSQISGDKEHNNSAIEKWKQENRKKSNTKLMLGTVCLCLSGTGKKKGGDPNYGTFICTYIYINKKNYSRIPIMRYRNNSVWLSTPVYPRNNLIMLWKFDIKKNHIDQKSNIKQTKLNKEMHQHPSM